MIYLYYDTHVQLPLVPFIGQGPCLIWGYTSHYYSALHMSNALI